MAKKRIYCDHNATTPIHKDVRVSFKKALDVYGNASSLYHTGRQAKEELEQARHVLGLKINAAAEQIVFCSSGTEANNHILNHFIYEKVVLNKPVHILASAIEHSSILSTLDYLKEFSIDYDLIPVEANGKVNVEAYKALFRKETALVSIMYANNEIGTIQDIKGLADIAHDHNCLFHCDAVQALGKIPIDILDLNIDYMSFSSHKIYAPKGCGALFIKNENTLSNLIHGGHQERGLRASTENIPGIIAFKNAIELINETEFYKHTLALTTLFKEELRDLKDIQINSCLDGLSNTFNISFPGCDGQALAMNCDLEGIDLSTGSACSVGSIEPSHVLKAIGLSDELNKSSLRISFGLTNTHEDIKFLSNCLKALVTRLRKV